MKTLLIIDKSTIHGGQRNLLDIASHLDKGEFQSLVVASPGGPLFQKCDAAGIPWLSLPVNKRFDPSALRALSACIRKENVEIIHSFGLTATVFAYSAGLRNGMARRIIYQQNGLHHRNYRNGLTRVLRVKMEKFIIGRIATTVCCCASDQEEGRKLGYFADGSSVVIMNGIDVKEIQRPYDCSAIRRELSIPDTQTVVGSLNYLHPQKGYTYLLDAIASIRDRLRGVTFLFPDAGPERSRVLKTAEGLGLEGIVRFMSFEPDYLKVLSVFDIYVTASLWEGLSLGLCEAMVTGKPVISTSVDGNKEMIVHGVTGLLVPPADSDALARAISRLLEDRVLRRSFSEKGRESATAMLDIGVMMERIQALYRQIRR